MIEQENGKYYASCDYCGTQLAPESSKDDSIMAMKKAGWRSPMIDTRIRNYCKKCAQYLQIDIQRGSRPRPEGIR